jgi:hypothetical protein
MDLPLAALLTWGLVAWVEARRGQACALFCVAALMKIPAPLSVPGALFVCLVADRRARRDGRAMAALALPFVVVALWLAYHRAVTGWTLSRRGVTTPAGLGDFATALWAVSVRLLLGEWRWVLLAAAVAAVAWIRARRGAWVDAAPVAPLLAVVAVGVLLFAGLGEFGLRYGIYLLPAYMVATLYIARAAVAQLVPFVGGAVVLVALFVTTWHPREPLSTSYEFRPDENLAYRDVIAIGVRSAHWLEQKHPDAEIYGAGPESYELTEPWQGYVDSPLSFSWCKAFEPHADRTQLVVVHAYHPQQPFCRHLTEVLGAKPIKHFESGSKWLEIYAVLKDQGASPSDLRERGGDGRE